MTEAGAQAAAPAPKGASADGDGRPIPLWQFLLFSLVVGAAVLLVLRVVVGVDIDPPTLGLALACVVLIWALRGMWGIVAALSRPPVEALIVESEHSAWVDHSTRAELREEKARVLRAIKELEFDHDMGKLSDEDFKTVVDRYKLRAIEVMRKLDDGDDLHDQLAAHLREVGVKLDESEVSA